MQTPSNEKKPLFYRLIVRTVRRVTPKYQLFGTENLPPEPCVIVGNHAQAYGPIAAELYMSRAHAIWCVGEMMNRKEVPAYAFQDFWSMKPKALHWFYRLASHLIAPLASFVLSNAHTIPVWHDSRVMTTFRKSIELLNAGTDMKDSPLCSDVYRAETFGNPFRSVRSFQSGCPERRRKNADLRRNEGLHHQDGGLAAAAYCRALLQSPQRPVSPEYGLHLRGERLTPENM